jgi:hypothetical protein
MNTRAMISHPLSASVSDARRPFAILGSEPQRFIGPPSVSHSVIGCCLSDDPPWTHSPRTPILGMAGALFFFSHPWSKGDSDQ